MRGANCIVLLHERFSMVFTEGRTGKREHQKREATFAR